MLNLTHIYKTIQVCLRQRLSYTYLPILALAFLMSNLSGCGTLTEMSVNTQQKTPDRFSEAWLHAEVDRLLTPLIADDKTPGSIVGVLTSDGKMYFYGYGVASKQTGETPYATTLFPIGSLSKGFLGSIAAHMVQNGELNWHDTLGELLPDAPFNQDVKKITLEQLATHSAGLKRQPITEKTLVYFAQFLFTGKNFYRHLDDEYIFNYLCDFSTPEEPTVTYSNIGYGLLGYVIEQRSQLPLEVHLKNRITTPLNLPQTGYGIAMRQQASSFAEGYAGDQPKMMRRGSPVPEWEFTRFMKGSAAVYSTAYDLLSYAKAHFAEDSSALTRALHDAVRVRIPRPKEAAAIAWVVDHIDDLTITYQVGLVAGYTSYIGLDTKHKNAVVVLQNAFNWQNKIGHQLLWELAHTPVVKP
jgi:CubicO group peptidase (beta-lactamase class C family)